MAVGNNGSRMVGNTEFYGGLSTDNKIGIENSYADGEWEHRVLWWSLYG